MANNSKKKIEGENFIRTKCNTCSRTRRQDKRQYEFSRAFVDITEVVPEGLLSHDDALSRSTELRQCSFVIYFSELTLLLFKPNKVSLIDCPKNFVVIINFSIINSLWVIFLLFSYPSLNFLVLWKSCEFCTCRTVESTTHYAMQHQDDS